MRSRSSTPNQNALSQAPSYPPPPPPPLHHYELPDQPSVSNLTSASTSNASIYSMHFHPHSRNSTPPTPLSSPGLFRPPSRPAAAAYGSDGANAAVVHHLHPSQYRQADPVRETHQLETDYDPISGRKIINHYSIIEEIGRGTHGKVKLGYDMSTKDLVAIKIVERSQGRPRLGRKGDGGESSETKIKREIAILKKIRHKNVVRLLEVIDDDRSKKVYLVLEYVVRGEVIWRKNGDPDVLRRDRQRLRREIAAAHARTTANNDAQQIVKRRRRRKARKTSTSFWSLEFASDSTVHSGVEDDDEAQGTSLHDDLSDTESVISILDDECYVPAMEIEEARKCFRDTVVGLDHLHWNGIIHRDIKPANLLWTGDQVTKISDFGVSFLGRPIRDDDDNGTGEDEPTGFEQDELELAKTAGTPAFFAPELCSMDAVRSNTPITGAIDVWALGVTLFCFIFGRLPFMADNEYTLFKCIAEEELVIPHLRLRPSKPNRILDHHLSTEELEDYETEPVDEDLRDLIKGLLTKNPAKRILLKDVKRHRWVLSGLRDPTEWVKRTDPEQSSYGHKIEVTVEDVETAVSTPGIVHKLRKVAGRAGSWLRKRGSSTTTTSKDSKQDLKEKPAAKGCDAPGDARSKQGQPSFLRYGSSDPDQELQWLGGVRDSREEEKLNPLAPSTTNSSAGSSETVYGHQTEAIEKDGEHEQWTAGPSGGLQHRASSDKKLRRKRSMALLGGNLLKRRSSHTPDPARPVRETHRSPIDPAPGSPMHGLPAHVVESIAALTAPATPALSRKTAQSPKNNDLVRAGGLSRRSSTYGGHREILAEAPYSRNNESDQDTLPTYTPEPRSLYTVINNMENGTLNISPKSTDTTTLKERIERQRREELELARRRLGKIGIYDDMLVQPCSLSPDDEIPSERTHDQQRHAMTLVEKKRERYSSPRLTRSADGWIQESVYHPFREPATPPMAMAPNSRSSEHSSPASPQNGPRGAPLRSSSGDEKSASTTAGSSFTNSASFPSTVTNPSSVSSDSFHRQYSHKGPLVSAEDVLSMDDDDRLRLMQAQNRERKTSELLFLPEEDSGSDSEGGFVMKSRAPKRTRGVTVDELARSNERLKDASHVRQHSRSSGGTVTDKETCEQRTEEQT